VQIPYVRVRTQRELPTHLASVVLAEVVELPLGEQDEQHEPQLASASF
jgi:hypothetical protein